MFFSSELSVRDKRGQWPRSGHADRKSGLARRELVILIPTVALKFGFCVCLRPGPARGRARSLNFDLDLTTSAYILEI